MRNFVKNWIIHRYSECKNSKKPIYIAILLLVFIVKQASAYIIIIGNNNISLDTLSVDNITAIYSNENMIGQMMLQGVNLPSKSSSYKTFYQLINTSPEEISSLQSKILFSNPFAYKAPITKNTTKEVIKTIATHKHLIGYIDSSQLACLPINIKILYPQTTLGLPLCNSDPKNSKLLNTSNTIATDQAATYKGNQDKINMGQLKKVNRSNSVCYQKGNQTICI